MNQDIHEISHALAVESYAFWSTRWEPNPSDSNGFKRVKTLDFRTAKKQDLWT